MVQVRAGVRLAGVAVMLLAGALIILPAGLLPGRVGGVRPALWPARGLAAVLCRLLGVRVRCAGSAQFRHPRLLVLPNHSSLLDGLVLLAVTPVRFLAAAEVARYPVIGRLARAIDTVFVARTDQASRQQARTAVAAALQATPYPPLVIFPEGRLGPGDRLFPFRHGAFAVAAEQGIGFVPCALRYCPRAVAVWRGGEGEPLWRAAWRLACSSQPITAEILPLVRVTPGAEDDPQVLAEAARRDLAAALGIDPEATAEAGRAAR
ncbi:MAG: 1-acyl-sn-glycerol-3-phosphate acyltransferase [Caldilineaceae bacterium]|nr:1-acyl-sn-glycerol-3-phosphate acyltransferase [Caldilineaceae bacterium]